MDNYVVYHLHSDLSTCVTSIDSVTKPDQYINKAKECGMKALAFSEHGSVFSWVKKKEHIEAAGMKYIHAIECYITETLEDKIKDNYHCVLIARNYEGVLEINKLSSKSFNRDDNHYYYVPRISMDELESTSNNIIICTACLANPLANGQPSIQRRFLNFILANKDRCFLEIQHHDEKRQKLYNKYLYKLSQRHHIRLIAGTDTHCLNEEHAAARKVLQKGKKISFPDEDAWDLVWKTYDELVEAYMKQDALPLDAVLDAINNTNVMADMVEEFTLDRSYKYPHLWDNPEKLFREKIEAGLVRRGVVNYPNKQEYLERIEYEMKAYIHNQAIDFMLLMEDIVSWCRSQNIQIGYGRGSVNGSVCAWLLGITEMDAIKHKLNFDRFMNVERVSLSDIDTDIPPNRIDEVKQYVFNRHGLYCCDIVTFNTIAEKGAIKDCCRALEIPLDVATSICKAYDEDTRKYEEYREQYKELFYYVNLVKNVVVSMGSHPCGTVCSPHSIDDKMGLCSTSTDNFMISQIYMKEIDSLNYVKLDLLKLDTIQLISDTCKAANIPMLTPDNMDINDEKVWDSIRNNTVGIFQWEKPAGKQYIKKLLSESTINKFKKLNENIDRMTLFSIGNSAIRPAGASYREDLANGVVRSSGNKAIDDFLRPTFGYLVFQCQIIEFLHSYCGFTMGEADIVRRCVDENTLITMANGKRKKIKDVNVGDQVMTLNELSGTFTYNYVNDVFCNGEKDVIEITTQHEHNLRLTGNHKVLTQNGWVEAASLTMDDYIMSPMRNHGYSDNKHPMPVKITRIKYAGRAHVYDLSVDTNHNYIANGLVVHNCFAKKTGTENWLPIIENGGESLGSNKRYIAGFVKTMDEKYNMEEDEAHRVIKAFLQVILDASDYLFSLNHSQPYSYEGYACGWLRYYYPVEFLTCDLNINKDNSDKTNEITAYALSQGITIKSQEYGKSSADYTCDTKKWIIYKGLASIKNLSSNMAIELYDFSQKKEYCDFIDLLKDLINAKICDSKQLDILIKINFFKKYGNINYLLAVKVVFDKLYNKKQMNIEKLKEFCPEYLIAQYCDCTTKDGKLGKIARFKDTIGLIRKLCGSIDYNVTTFMDVIKYELECIGSIQTMRQTAPDDIYVIQDIDGSKNNILTLYHLRDGSIKHIKSRAYKCRKPQIGMFIKILNIEFENKWRKNEEDKWYQIEEKEEVLKKYNVIEAYQ